MICCCDLPPLGDFSGLYLAVYTTLAVQFSSYVLFFSGLVLEGVNRANEQIVNNVKCFRRKINFQKKSK